MESRGCINPNNIDHQHHQISSPACPRCGSSNTKFCYYNNYSLTQPRYFCKGCRRYWTKGGSLRNVPIGGGCRKSRRAKSSIISRSTLCHNDGIIVESSSTPFQSNHDHMVSNNNSTIDLGAVYANFLNTKTSHNIETVSFHDGINNVLIPSIDNFANLPSTLHTNQLSSGGNFLGDNRQLLGDENGVYFTMNNFTLPPSEDVVVGNSGELLWPEAGPGGILPSHEMLVHSNLDDRTTRVDVEREAQNLELLNENLNNNIMMNDQFSAFDIEAVFRS
ncbi:hypothetical protein ACJIZ3_023945 [Penstemon smallii]|uniref:Dof zinc finger protein n=1 Tax=Penstemon smallii TaxID=265156 RepID=A0ABD3TQF1_9LAMI